MRNIKARLLISCGDFKNLFCFTMAIFFNKSPLSVFSSYNFSSHHKYNCWIWVKFKLLQWIYFESFVLLHRTFFTLSKGENRDGFVKRNWVKERMYRGWAKSKFFVMALKYSLKSRHKVKRVATRSLSDRFHQSVAIDLVDHPFHARSLVFT